MPILTEPFPTLHYAEGLIGSGREVSGFNTEMSTAHSWGPHVHLFLQDEDSVIARICEKMPYFGPFLRGYSVK